MTRRDLLELLALAALWGGSFLFMRIAVPAFGPVTLAALRVVGAALVLLPLLAWQRNLPALRRHWRPIAAVGLFNSALPFLAFAYAAQSIDSGIAAIFNSATPLFAAIIAWLWLADRMTAARVLGLVVGFAGVAWIAWSRPRTPGDGSLVAVFACLAGTVCYGVSPSLAKRWLTGVPPLAVAAGSQLAAALLLALPALAWWPATSPAPSAWAAMAALAVFCTGLAYILYFRLIASAGPANAVAVTYLVPIFAIAWGAMFLGERLTAAIAVGCVVVFVGTALATGVLHSGRFRRPTRRAPAVEAPPRSS